jgi:hypothetical protein
VIDLHADFLERVKEVDAYLDLVTAIEHAVQSGAPMLRTRAGATMTISPTQQKILYAGVYLHLYNLVEATVSRCIVAVEEAASSGGARHVGDLSEKMRSEWVRTVAKTHRSMDSGSRLEAAVELCEHVMGLLPVQLTIDKDGGGNWDDVQIYKFAERIGVTLMLEVATQRRVKSPFRDNKGPLKAIKFHRNKLAHGEVSFSECGENHSASELLGLKDMTIAYLKEVIGCFDKFIQQHEFLHPDRRPSGCAG